MDQSTDQAMRLAIKHHQAGNFTDAEKIYRQVLSLEPTNAGALNLLGAVALQTGQIDVAIELMRQAVSIAPGVADFHLNLGNALHSKGLLRESVAAYRQALTLDPRNAKAHNNLGNVLQDLAELNEAIACYLQAIQLDAHHAAAHGNLAGALRKTGQLDDAIMHARQAISLQPELVAAHLHLGLAQMDKGRFDEAIASCQRAIALQPNLAEAHSNLADALAAHGQTDGAVESYRRAISHNPRLAGAQINLALALADQGNLDDAIVTLRSAVEIDPGHPKGYLNLLYFLYHHPDYDARQLLEETRKWAQLQSPGKSTSSPFMDPTRKGRIKIGYLSSFFRICADSYFIVPLLAHHDHDDFEIFCYSQSGDRDDEVSDHLRSHSDHWIDLRNLSIDASVEAIRGHNLDVLVNISRPAERCQMLLANRLAPIQITWLTFASCTTALETMNYRISDPYIDPLGTDEMCYREKTLRLPDTAWCYDPLCELPPVNTLPRLTNGVITFGSFNRFHKINKLVIGAWVKVLRSVPESRLRIFAALQSHRRQLLDHFCASQIDPARIEFVDQKPRIEYLKEYGGVDVILDTFPFAGLTTVMDSLCMGVPVVTLSGATCVGRIAAGVLHNIGLRNLIARDLEEYVSLAVGLSQDVTKLTELRAGLRKRVQASPLMDGRGFARNVEAVYRHVWQSEL